MTDTHIDTLYQNLEDMGVDVFTCPYPSFKAVASPDGFLGINPYNMDSTAEERVALIHEEGHFATHTFYEYDAPYTIRAHQENLADRYGFKKYFPPEKIQAAINEGKTESWQLAEHFGVPTAYIESVVSYYIESCGVTFHSIDAPIDDSGPPTPEMLAGLQDIETSLYTPNLTYAQAQDLLHMAELLRKQGNQNETEK